MAFTKSKVSAELKFVGAYVSPRIHEFLTLYSIAKQTHKTTVIRKMFDEWLICMRVKESDKLLIDEIIRKALTRWKVDKSVNPNKTIHEFKVELETELMTKGVKNNHINSILAGIR